MNFYFLLLVLFLAGVVTGNVTVGITEKGSVFFAGFKDKIKSIFKSKGE